MRSGLHLFPSRLTHSFPGTYDPIPKLAPQGEEGKPYKDIKLDIARAKYWLGVGAQPSDPAWRLLSMVSLFHRKAKPLYGLNAKN